MKAYPKTKPSGVEWLGDVPEHWEVKRGRFAMRVNPPAPRLRALKPEDEVSFVPMEAVGVGGGLSLEQSRVLAVVAGGYTEFQDGDVVVAKITPCFENGKAALADGLLNGAAYGTTELHVLRAGPTLDPSFLFYVAISDTFRKLGESGMYGAGGQKRVPPEFNKDFRTPLPPLTEQAAIAAYLDRETGRIDELVGKKRELIERLKEKRSALISRTVTRGLPADLPPATLAKLEALAGQKLPLNPPLKPSGIDWLGDVPEHWEVKPVKRAINFLEGPGIMAADFMEDGIPLLRISCIGGRKATLDGCNYVSEELATTRWAHFRVRSGDLLISGSASTGFCSEVDQETIGSIPYTGIIIIRPMPGKTVRDFVRWFFLSDLFADQAALAKTGSTIQHFGPTHLSRMVAVLPPLTEQRAIAAYLDEETAKLDALVSKVETAIERLQEYRTALITAAVTGKINTQYL